MQLDIKKGSKGVIEVFQGDSMEGKQIITLIENDRLLDLTDLICDMAYVDVDNNYADVIGNLNIYNATGGQIELPINANITKRPGVYNCELRLKDKDNKNKYTAFFSLIVQENVFSKAAPFINNSKNFEVLQDLLDKADSYNQELKNATDGLALKYADKVNALDARMNNFTSLKDGSTTGDAELQDIRVGADGTTYKSAGEAVRKQFDDVSNELFKIHISKNILPPTKVNNLAIASWLKDFNNCTYANTGSITTNAISVTPGTFLKCIKEDNTICNFNISAIFYDGKDATSYVEGNIIEVPKGMIKAKFSFVNTQNMPDAIIVCETKDETPVYEPYGDTTNKLFVSTDEFNSFKDSIKNTISLNNVNANELPLQNIDKTGGYTSIFRKIGIIGDSLSSGAQDIQDGGSAFDCWEHSWGSYLGRATGAEIIKLCQGGLMTRNWHSVFEAKAREENNKCTAYILMLGHNGKLTGSIDDVNVTSLKDSADTTYGQYAKIIGTLREVAPQAKIFCVTYPIKYIEEENKNNMIREVASKLNCYLIDLYKYGIDKDIFSKVWNQKGIGNPEKDKEKIHFTPLAYLKWSWEIQSYIDYIIRHNPDDFVNVGYINTSYTFN